LQAKQGERRDKENLICKNPAPFVDVFNFELKSRFNFYALWGWIVFPLLAISASRNPQKVRDF